MISGPQTAQKKTGRVRKFAILLTTHTMIGLAGLAAGISMNMQSSLEQFRKAAIQDTVKSVIAPESITCTGVNPATKRHVTVSIIEDKAYRFRFSTMHILVLAAGETIPTRITEKRGWTQGEVAFRNGVTKKAFAICGKSAPKF